MGCLTIKAFFRLGHLCKVEISGESVTDIEYFRMYDAVYWKFEYNGNTYRFGLNRVLIVDNKIYIPENIDESEHRGGKWTEKIRYRKAGEVVEFPVVWTMIRDHRLGDLVEYGVRLTVNGKEIFDDTGRPWKERYARVLRIVGGGADGSPVKNS